MVGETLVGQGADEQLPAALWRAGPKAAEHNFSQSCQKIQGGTKAAYCSLWGPNWEIGYSTPFFTKMVMQHVNSCSERHLCPWRVLKLASMKPLLMQCWQQPCFNWKVRLDDLQPTLPLKASMTKMLQVFYTEKGQKYRKKSFPKAEDLHTFPLLVFVTPVSNPHCISEREPVMSDRLTAAPAPLLQACSYPGPHRFLYGL